jgi:DNA modification methylase
LIHLWGGGGTTLNGHSGYKKSDGTLAIYPFRNKRSVWTITTKPYKGAHFATFPPDLISPCILAGCPKGGIVLDPFNGSGTTGQVAIQNNRDYIGIELNPAYIELTMKRLSNIENQLSLIP